MENIEEIINIEKVAEKIFDDMQNSRIVACNCPNCNENMDISNENNKYLKCKKCNFSFVNPNNNVNLKIKNDKILKLIICMLRDFTLEETIKFIDSNAETIKNNWKKIYNCVNWSKYNIQVRSEPITRIYSTFEVILS